MKYGSEHGRWVGDKAGYTACHDRVRTALGTPSRCEECGLSDPKRTYHWANLTGKYHDFSDYKRMCVPCHRRYDYRRMREKNPDALLHKNCKRGHPLTEGNIYFYKEIRSCKICHLNRSRRWKRKHRMSCLKGEKSH